MTDGAAAGQCSRLMYRSRSLIPTDDRKAELGRLFTTARSRNKQAGICGALLVSGDTFVQVLEGEPVAVRSLFAHISGDPRHSDVVLLREDTIEAPVFARWAMAEMAAEGKPDIPLIAHADGISPAASRGTSSEQEFVLDSMRQAARGAHAAR